MLRLSVIFLWLMLLMTQAARASAEDYPSFTAEDFRYDYAGNGVPTVFLTIVNTGKEPVRPVVKVTVNKAYSTSQDAFHYRKRASLRTKGLPVVMPGGKEPVRLSMGKSLKPGDYEAIVEFPQMEMLIDRRFDFSVAESDQRTVKRCFNKSIRPDSAIRR
ncbi:hypothetical protein [Cohnella hashimotonis]|uniref:Copper chaperone PCu(A)C n=1 Tax=Cohnella hashimotonis TaxID=2826895 RepID=A0ABT6TIT5_9BACL|nr:hypothetical protein [Cohnella hashimotonis]MDI4645762.1 hypothetical protein [Cohnella hashimotonis]